MTFEGGPYVQAACFCDMVVEDKTAVLSLIRIVDTLTHQAIGPDAPKEMPHVQHRMKLVVMLKSGKAQRRFDNQVKSGQLVARLRKNSHREKPPASEPVCTWSQILVYYSLDGKPVAIVHQYLRPDGTIGGSGLPDPKRLFFPDRIVSVRSQEGKRK